MHAQRLSTSLPIPTFGILLSLVAGGVAADLVWEFWARIITPMFIGGPLQPAALILSLFRLPESWYGFAEGVHLFTGAVGYPILFWLIMTYVFRGGRVVDGLVIGIVTWILALGVFATLAGLPFMLGFIPLTWMSGIGHCLYGLTLSLVFHAVSDGRD